MGSRREASTGAGDGPGRARASGVLALAGLALLASTTLVGWFAEVLLPLLPPVRLGPFDVDEVTWLAWAVRPAWALAQILVALGVLRTARSARQGPRRVLRLALAWLGFAALLYLPLLSWDGARALARGRYVLPTYALLAAAAVRWLHARGARGSREAEPAVPERGVNWTLRFGYLAAAAMLLVLLGETAIDLELLRSLRYVPDFMDALELLQCLAVNSAVLLAGIGLLLALSGRRLFSFLAVGALYAVLVFANTQKLTNLQSPLSVLDAHYLAELRPLLTGIVSPAVLTLAATVLGLALFGLIVVFRRAQQGPTRAMRALGVGVLLLAGSGIYTVALPRAARSTQVWNPRRTSLTRGLAFDLLIGALTRSVQRPPGYSHEEIERILAEHTRDADRAPADALAPNLVLLLVESLTDPLSFGFELTEDPMPFMRSLAREGRHGTCISPAFGSQSANVEFELLTGMSMGFLPVGSLTYRQFLHHRTPSLAWSLGARGHRVRAIIVDPRSYFDRPRCYPLLGFDDVVWLDELQGVERDASGRYASDEAVVDAILALDEEPSPFFAFAFSNASHAPYDPAPFGPSAVTVVNAPNDRIRKDLGGYASAIRAVDRGVERLVNHFRGSEHPTLVVILGDHLPPFAGPAGVYEESGMFGDTAGERLLRRHVVPIWIWANYDIGREPLTTGANFVGIVALETMGIDLDPFQQVVQQVEADYHAFSRVVAPREGVPRTFQLTRERRSPHVRDYELLQYDILFGGRSGQE